MPIELHQIRDLFPALRGDSCFLDNAGGSQLPDCVIGASDRCLRSSYAQLGGTYPASRRAAATVKRAHEVVRSFLNAGPEGEVVLGASTTQLCHLLAGCYADAPLAGRNEVIIATAGHEANIGPWARLERRGWRVTFWPTERDTDGRWRPHHQTLGRLLSDRTRVVAFPHVSNVLGEVWDARAITALAHAAGARTVVDGVAFAPHRAPDVAAMGCDWYMYSAYKVFGPHMAALYGRRDAVAELPRPNHYFLPTDDLSYGFELGGCPHEGCAMLGALWTYVCTLTGVSPDSPPDRGVFERAFARVSELEDRVQRPLLEWLRSRSDFEIIGPPTEEDRVCTISFMPRRHKPSQLAARANAEGLGIRYGHFYSRRLIDELGLDPTEGVVRASLLHYTSGEEVERLIRFLERVS